jgi:hypothetical protein
MTANLRRYSGHQSRSFATPVTDDENPPSVTKTRTNDAPFLPVRLIILTNSEDCGRSQFGIEDGDDYEN